MVSYITSRIIHLIERHDELPSWKEITYNFIFMACIKLLFYQDEKKKGENF